jgi:PAS domain S-box-containing protein
MPADSERLIDISGDLDFRTVAEAMPQLVWVASADGTVEYFNQRWIDYTGLTLADMAKSGVKNVVHPEDLDETWERWLAALTSGEPYEIEYRLRCAGDGTYRWFVARALPVRDEDGTVARWIGSATEIEAQKRANANLAFVIEASAALSTAHELQKIYDILAELAIGRVADWCFIVVPDGGAYRIAKIAHRDMQMLHYVEHFAQKYPARRGSTVDIAIRKNISILTPNITGADLRAAAEDQTHLEILQRLRMHSSMIVPLSCDSRVHGAVVLVSAESGRSFSQNDLEVAEKVARRAALSIETALEFREERSRSERLRFIARATELVFEPMELRTGFDRLVELIVSQMADLAYVMIFEGDGALRTVACAHRDPRKHEIAKKLRGERTLKPAAEEVAAGMLSQHRTIVNCDVHPEEILPHMWEYLAPDVRSLGVRSAITVPLFARGETYGALIAYWCETPRCYSEADVPIFEDLGRRVSMAIEHVGALERERRISASLQDALLPSETTFPRHPDLSFDAYYRASLNEAKVGGDWFDSFPRSDGSIVVCVGDVTGRGLEAAGLMAKLRQSISMAAMYEQEPERILDAVDRHLRSRRAEALATAFIGIIDPSHRRMRYANAGHPPPLLRTKDGITELTAEGLPLGLRDYGGSSQGEVSLDEAELLLLYTDGLIEGTRDLLFGERRLREVVRSDAAMHVRNPARLFCDACLPLDAQDDTAVLTVLFGNKTSWQFDAENARAANETRREFVDRLRQVTESVRDLNAAELVFGELVGNVVRHAPGPIDVQLDLSGHKPALHVIDRGRGFIRDPALPADPLSENGRGLFIIQQLADDVRVERIAGYGNHVTATLKI